MGCALSPNRPREEASRRTVWKRRQTRRLPFTGTALSYSHASLDHLLTQGSRPACASLYLPTAEPCDSPRPSPGAHRPEPFLGPLIRGAVGAPRGHTGQAPVVAVSAVPRMPGSPGLGGGVGRDAGSSYSHTARVQELFPILGGGRRGGRYILGTHGAGPDYRPPARRRREVSGTRPRAAMAPAEGSGMISSVYSLVVPPIQPDPCGPEVPWTCVAAR